jgi:hypothetical protein
METLSAVLPIVIDSLIACLLVAIIVLVIKVIGILDDARLLIDNIIDKVNTVNGLFSAIKKIDRSINGVAKRLVDIVESTLSKVPTKSKPSDEEIELDEILKGRK